MIFLKVRIQSKYSRGFYKFTTKNQSLITRLWNRNPIGSEKIINNILHQYLKNKFKKVFIDFDFFYEKFKMIKIKKRRKRKW